MSRFTPGPWEAHDRAQVSYVAAKTKIADVWSEAFGDRDNQVANARLISAAPELLEALKEVVAISDRKHNAWDKAHAAIAKAEG